MKRSLLGLALVAFAALALAAHSEPSASSQPVAAYVKTTPTGQVAASERCVGVGQVAEAIAYARDAGTDASRTLAIVLANTDSDARAIVLAKAEVDYAYLNRSLTPPEVGQLRQNACNSRRLRGTA